MLVSTITVLVSTMIVFVSTITVLVSTITVLVSTIIVLVSVGLGSCKRSIGLVSLLKFSEAILAPENEARLNSTLFLGTTL